MTDGKFAVMEVRKTKTGSSWREGSTVVEHFRLREVLDQRFDTGAKAQAAAEAWLQTKVKGGTAYVVELRAVVTSTVEVKTKVRDILQGGLK